MNTACRQLEHTISAYPTSDGEGVKLKRCVSSTRKDMLDPFLLLDEFASDDASDYIGGFPEHPHRGFETVTYMLEGAMQHRDHLGNEGHLRPGSVQWMTAAHGIIHSEMPEQVEGRLHGFQLWLNLPAKDKMKPPHYQEFNAEEIPHVSLAGGGVAKVIAGDFVQGPKKTTGPASGVATRPLYIDVMLPGQQEFNIPVAEMQTVLIYVYKNELHTGQPGKILRSGQLGKLVSGRHVHIETGALDSRFLLLAAEPLREPVAQWGPFVMNTREEVEQAIRDYRDGKLTM